jgi:hypothetical protein
MRAFLSSAFEHFLSFICLDQLTLTYGFDALSTRTDGVHKWGALGPHLACVWRGGPLYELCWATADCTSPLCRVKRCFRSPVTGPGDCHVPTVDSCPSCTRGKPRHPYSASAFSRAKPGRAVSSRARRGVLCVLLAPWAWRPGHHTDVDMPAPRMPVGRLAAVSRHAPRTTFSPCQSLGGLDTHYGGRQRRKDHRSSAAPQLSKRGVEPPAPSRALPSTDQRHRCAACLPWLPSFHATQPLCSSHLPASGRQPWSAAKRDEESPSTSRRQARAVSGWRAQECPRSARTAREP